MGWGVGTEEVKRLMYLSRATGDFARAIVVVLLFSLLMALWAWLWVPPAHVF